MGLKIEDKNYIKTSDFQLSSYFVCKNIDLIRIEKESPTKAVFIFPRNKKTQELMHRFSNLAALVEPLAFSSAQKRLKQLLYISLRS